MAPPRRNIFSIKNASHVNVHNLEIDGRGAFVYGAKAEGHPDFAHHIKLENLGIHSLTRHQQSVGISTKCRTNWSPTEPCVTVIRRNYLVKVAAASQHPAARPNAHGRQPLQESRGRAVRRHRTLPLTTRLGDLDI